MVAAGGGVATGAIVGVAAGQFVSVVTGGGGGTDAGGGVCGGVAGGGVAISVLPVSFMSCINAARAAACAGVSSARVKKGMAHKAMAATAGKSLGVCI